MASPLAITVTADLSGLSRGMADAARISQDGGRVMAASLRNVEIGAAKAADSIKAFSREQGQQARVVNRLTSEISAVIPMSAEAANVTRGLGGAFYEVGQGVFTFGAALAAVGAAMAVYRALTKEAEEQIKKLEDAQNAEAKAVEAAADKARTALILRRQTMFASKEQAAAALEEQRNISRARDQVARYTYEIEDAKKQLAAADGDAYKRGIRKQIEDLNKDLENAKANFNALVAAKAEFDKTAANLNQFSTLGVAPSAGLTPEEIAGEAERARREREVRDAATKAANARFAPVMAANAAERNRWGMEQHGGYGFDADAARRRAEMAEADRQELEDNLTKYAGDASERRYKGAATDVGMSQGGIDKALDAHAKKVKATQDAYKKLGEAGARALGDILSGHKTVGEALADLGKQALAMGAKWAVTQIMNAALKAGAEGAASSAQAGPAGVVAAPGVMASLIAMVSGLAGSVVAAHGGADFAGFPSEFPILAKSREMMLPPEDAETMRKLRQVHIDGEGGGRYSVNLSIDGREIIKTIEFRPRDFRRSVERASRSAGS